MKAPLGKEFEVMGIKGRLIRNTRGRFWYRQLFNCPCPFPVYLNDRGKIIQKDWEVEEMDIKRGKLESTIKTAYTSVCRGTGGLLMERVKPPTYLLLTSWRNSVEVLTKMGLCDTSRDFEKEHNYFTGFWRPWTYSGFVEELARYPMSFEDIDEVYNSGVMVARSKKGGRVLRNKKNGVIVDTSDNDATFMHELLHIVYRAAGIVFSQRRIILTLNKEENERLSSDTHKLIGFEGQRIGWQNPELVDYAKEKLLSEGGDRT